MMRRNRAAIAAACLGISLASGCAMTPDEIQAVQAENELLREQIAALREKCLQGRELEIRRETPGDDEER
jgi:hypothetical protein